MARILYGVQGDAHGHAIRALTVARHYPEHDFQFVSYDYGARLLQGEFSVFECAGLETIVHNHQLATAHTICSNIQFFSRERRLMAEVMRLIDEFKPDIAITDYEYFVPRACRRAGVPCLSLDHQHMITSCFHRFPPRQFPSYVATYLAVRCLFSSASQYLVTSFFRPPQRRVTTNVQFVPPLLRERVTRVKPSTGDHVLAYRSHPPSKDFIPFLRDIHRPVMVYGFDMDRRDGNLHFKKRSEEGFLEDLASCSYVICSGGHTLMSEALFYGKPIISFPIDKLFEQFMNAFYLEKLGYGRYFSGYALKPGTIPSFEARVDEFRNRITKGTFSGNEQIFSALDYFIRNKHLAFG